MKHRTKLTFVFLLLFLPTALHENERPSVLSETIDFCLKLSSDQSVLIEEFESIGWTKTSGGQGITATHVLFSFFFTSKHRSEDLNYTYLNSQFMAASILGNSALKPNQPFFINGEMRLSVLGAQESEGFCILTGPRWATIEIEKKFGITLNRLLPYLKSYSGEIGAHNVSVQEIDIDKFHLIKPATSNDNLEKYRSFEKEALQETNLLIGRRERTVK